MCKLLRLRFILRVRHILGHLWGPLRENLLPSKHIFVSMAMQLLPFSKHLSCSFLCGNVYAKRQLHPVTVRVRACVCVSYSPSFLYTPCACFGKEWREKNVIRRKLGNTKKTSRYKGMWKKKILRGMFGLARAAKVLGRKCKSEDRGTFT